MAGNFLNKLLDYIGIEEAEYEDDEFQEDFYDQQENDKGKVLSLNNRGRKNPANNVVNLPTAAQMKVIVYHPISYEDTQNIIDNLKSRKPVIVNMEELEIECAQRILDFMAGAVYALNGTIYKISRGIFVVAPNNYDIIGSGDSAINDGII
ncbi:MAG: Cell division protein SepF [Firmicutes bacterium ADurb.Bin182]|nr:MAG: Cell division protein SepF [Firmicutes bacterium ADurb.Bin182]